MNPLGRSLDTGERHVGGGQTIGQDTVDRRNQRDMRVEVLSSSEESGWTERGGTRSGTFIRVSSCDPVSTEGNNG